MIVVEAHQGPDATRHLWLFVDQATELTPLDIDHIRVAFDERGRFGEGQHPAGLDLGNCFAYATAVLADATLLFGGGRLHPHRYPNRAPVGDRASP